MQPEIEEDGSLEAMGDALAALLRLDGPGSESLHRECCNFITNFARILGFKVSKVAARLVPALVDRLRFESQVRSSFSIKPFISSLQSLLLFYSELLMTFNPIHFHRRAYRWECMRLYARFPLTATATKERCCMPY